VTLHTGRAQDVIPSLNYTFDLVFIDGDKREYCEYFDLAFEKGSCNRPRPIAAEKN